MMIQRAAAAVASSAMRMRRALAASNSFAAASSHQNCNNFFSLRSLSHCSMDDSTDQMTTTRKKKVISRNFDFITDRNKLNKFMRKNFNKSKTITFEDALALCDRMFQMQSLTCISHFNQLLIEVSRMSTECSGFSEVLMMYKRMVKGLTSPRVDIGFCFSILGTVLKLGYQPDTETLNLLLHGICFDDEVVKAVEFFQEFQIHGFVKAVEFFQEFQLIHFSLSREAAPSHFLFKIESFSLLSKNSILKYESNEFETGGYKWKLSLYPEGNKNESGNGHISLYLVLVADSSNSLPAGWELNVLFRLFLFDHIRDRYLIHGDTQGRTRWFHEMKRMCGFPQFVSLANFNDPANGYLVDDTCVFGAEVFITTPPGNIECLSMVKQATTRVTHTWKIDKFSKIIQKCLYSKKFKAAGYNWDLMIYPREVFVENNNSVDLFLYLTDCQKDPGLKVYANIKLRIRDQINGKHIQPPAVNHWFCASSDYWGWPKFIGLDEMKNKRKGYLVKDKCIVEAEIEVLGIVSKRP